MPSIRRMCQFNLFGSRRLLSSLKNDDQLTMKQLYNKERRRIETGYAKKSLAFSIVALAVGYVYLTYFWVDPDPYLDEEDE